mmetsp:Transcript_9351/g.20704  ORF Transcript_9351/g.20704 Transcript_9351/m.20704 type:complete len:256 (+) Transcript_9351:271-1038(+)
MHRHVHGRDSSCVVSHHCMTRCRLLCAVQGCHCDDANVRISKAQEQLLFTHSDVQCANSVSFWTNLCCSGEPILLLNALHGLTFSPVIGFPHGHVAQGATQDETTSECTDTKRSHFIQVCFTKWCLNGPDHLELLGTDDVNMRLLDDHQTTALQPAMIQDLLLRQVAESWQNPQGYFSLGMPNLHQPQHVGPRSCDLQILWLGWEAEAVHTARQLAFAYDLLGIPVHQNQGRFSTACGRHEVPRPSPFNRSREGQ